MKEQITEALIYYHSQNKEWVSLKEIYKKVEEIRGIPNASKGASIRRIVETHSKVSRAFEKEELFISKGKRTGLYKSIYYDRVKFINNMNIGDIFTRDQLIALFKISGQAGMMKTNSLNALALITSEESVYSDSLINDGKIQYTGEGLLGDQTLTKNNKTLFYSKEKNLPVYLFTKDKKRRYVFEGRVILYDKPYQIMEYGINGKKRLVWKFPLAVVYANNEVKEEKYDEVIHEISQIEEKIYFNMDNLSDIEYKEGKLNIRKYRRVGKKSLRYRKPDYIAEEIIKTRQGIINEETIYKRELERLKCAGAKEQVKKMEEFFKNRKDNEGFDILSFKLNNNEVYEEMYIEVKSTKGSESIPIDITSDEIEFAKNHIDNYYLYRVVNSDKEEMYLKIVRGRDLFYNKDYKFVPITYKIYSN